MKTKTVALEGLVSGDELDKTYRKRNKKYVYKRITRQGIQPFADEGWEKTGYKSKTHFRLRRLKDIGPGFEDEVWCIFKRMAFDEMNADSTFVIPRYGSDISKQIDVFAKDDQCICFVECKEAKRPHTKRSLDKDIDQLAAIRHDIELSVFSHYRDPEKRKKFRAVWILATKNIDVGKNDLERAKKSRIRILDDVQIEYYLALTKHFGKASKYLFLADMLPGIDIPGLLEPVPAMRGKLGKRVFYSFVMEPEKLMKIGFIAHRAKTTGESIETYQRIAKKSRLKKIAQYIEEKEGIFPTSIVINIQSKKPLRFDPAPRMGGRNAKLGTLHIPNKYQTAWIIDGQHRLFAYSDLEEAETATLPVIAFENLDTDEQARLFVDINGEQVKVPKSLLTDLWATIHWNSDNPSEQLKALASKLVKVLGDHRNSPLRDRIVNIGGKRSKTKNITFAAIVDELNGKQLLGSIRSRKAKSITPGPLFGDDLESTLNRSRDVISGYLDNYINNNKNLERQWQIGGGEGGFICTNTGLIATFRVLKAILDHMEHVDHVDIRKMKCATLLDKVWKYQEPVCEFLGSASPQVIHDFRQQRGQAGYRICSLALLQVVNEKYKNLKPPGLEQYIQSQDKKNNPRAFDLAREIEESIMNHVIPILKEIYGEDISQWWHDGIPKSVRDPTVELATSKGEYYHPEKFLTFIDWKDIVYSRWDLFGDKFTIDAKSNDSKKKRLAWLVKANDIRNIASHPPRGGVTDEQLEYMINICDELLPKLKKD